MRSGMRFRQASRTPSGECCSLTQSRVSSWVLLIADRLLHRTLDI